MMDVQLNEIIEYLNEKNYSCIKITENSFFVDLSIANKVLRIRIDLPEAFPYQLPTIKLLKEFYDSKNPWPHIENENAICLYDNDVVSVDVNRPCEIVRQSIDKAKKVINEGYNGSNKKEFIEEFQQYWIKEKGTYRVIYFELEEDEGSSNYYYSKLGSNIVLARSKGTLKKYFKRVVGKKLSDKDIYDCLYIELSTMPYPPYPSTLEETEAFMDLHDKRNEYLDYLNKRKKRDKVVLFSLEDKLHGWIIKDYKFNKQKNKLGGTIKKFTANEITRERVLTRGGDGIVIPSMSCSIIGCGSLGSLFAMNAAQSGIDEFILLDKDYLLPDNIGRHLCGASDIFVPKTTAVKSHIERHFPYISCTEYCKSIYELDEVEADVLFKSDIQIVAIGNSTTEFYLDLKYHSDDFNGIRVYIWTEPLMLGGHALILNGNQYKLSEFFDSDGLYKDRILVNPWEYTKKDHGCQTTYVPYSGLTVSSFVSKVMRFIMDRIILSPDISDSFQYFYVGDLKKARIDKIEIQDKWYTSDNYTEKIKRI